MAGEVTITLSEGDYIAANRDWFLLAVPMRERVLNNVVTVGLCAGLGAALAWLRGRDIAAEALLFALIGVLLVGFGYGIGYLLLPRCCRALFRQQSTLSDPVRCFWSESGFGYRSARASADIAWTDYFGWPRGAAASSSSSASSCSTSSPAGR